MPYSLPPLPYAPEALAPVIDAETMRLHHGKHHQAYLDKLNEALAIHPEAERDDPADLLRNLDAVPDAIRMVVRNHGGGYVNHSFFWESMRPGAGGEPTGTLAAAITAAFGSFADFQVQFVEEGTRRFGSGWVWLVRGADGALAVTSTSNQDSPLSIGQVPLLGNDLWEHAYYLQYQNRRAEYLKAWWAMVDWEKVSERFEVE